MKEPISLKWCIIKIVLGKSSEKTIFKKKSRTCFTTPVHKNIILNLFFSRQKKTFFIRQNECQIEYKWMKNVEYLPITNITHGSKNIVENWHSSLDSTILRLVQMSQMHKPKNYWKYQYLAWPG